MKNLKPGTYKLKESCPEYLEYKTWRLEVTLSGNYIGFSTRKGKKERTDQSPYIDYYNKWCIPVKNVYCI